MARTTGDLDWATATGVLKRAFRSSFHNAIATVDPDGAPRVTTIGSVMLTEPGRGIFFDVFASQRSQNLDNDPRVCDGGRHDQTPVADVNRSWSFRSSACNPTRGNRRPTSRTDRRGTAEVAPSGTLGSPPQGPRTPFWGNLTHVRELEFEEALPVRLGAMTRGSGV